MPSPVGLEHWANGTGELSSSSAESLGHERKQTAELTNGKEMGRESQGL